MSLLTLSSCFVPRLTAAIPRNNTETESDRGSELPIFTHTGHEKSQVISRTNPPSEPHYFHELRSH